MQGNSNQSCSKFKGGKNFCFLRGGRGEAKSVEEFLKPVDGEVIEIEQPVKENQDYASAALRSATRQKMASDRNSCLGVFPLSMKPTSDQCESIFSVSERTYSKQRKSVDVVNLESQLFLKLNRDLWS